MKVKLPKADPQAWKDMDQWMEWVATETEWDDSQVLAVCRLFLDLNDIFEQRENDKVWH